MKNGKLKILALALLAGLFSCEPKMGEPVAQISLQRIDQMPDLPKPLKIIDWKKKAIQLDIQIYLTKLRFD